jgi:hypothetical protein
MVQVVIHGILMDQNKKDLENGEEEDRLKTIQAWILVNLEIADVLLKGKSELKMTSMCHFSTCLVSLLNSLQLSEIALKMKSMCRISTCLVSLLIACS